MNTTRASLLARLKDLDNTVAWREFDELYRPMLQRFTRACGVNGAVADDLVQECMAAIVKHIGRFEHEPGRGAFRGWLRTIVVNRVLDLCRKRSEPQADSKDLRGLADGRPTPQELFDQICSEEHLGYCIRRLREVVESSTFEAFERYVLKEEPIETVCAALGMTVNQVHKIKWRVTRKLAELMKELE